MPEDGLRYLDRLWQSTCNEKRIRRAVSLSFAGPWTQEGSGVKALLHGRLVLTRESGSDALSVDQVQGSVLFDLSLPSEGELAAGAEQASCRWTSGPAAATSTPAARAPRPSCSGSGCDWARATPCR